MYIMQHPWYSGRVPVRYRTAVLDLFGAGGSDSSTACPSVRDPVFVPYFMCSAPHIRGMEATILEFYYRKNHFITYNSAVFIRSKHAMPETWGCSILGSNYQRRPDAWKWGIQWVVCVVAEIRRLLRQFKKQRTSKPQTTFVNSERAPCFVHYHTV